MQIPGQFSVQLNNLGSAPTPSAANRGVEDRRIKLGCMVPGESPAVFGDALRRLASSATYLYQDGPRYWYSTQPTVTKLAEDRAEQLKRDPDRVHQELDRRLRRDLETKGDFRRVHTLPANSTDVSDDADARLVVLGIEHPYSKGGESEAVKAAEAILNYRGNAPRLHRNALVFLAADRARLQDLETALRNFLAWESILAEKDTLDLSPHQVKQAETQRKAADGTVAVRIPETYQWILVPVQSRPDAAVEFQAIKVTGQEALAVRAGKKLRNEELLITGFAPTRLRMELDRVPLWRGDHVSVRQLVEDFSRYLYLPRLAAPHVLADAMAQGVALLTWEKDSFGYAESYDEEAKRYRGLRGGASVVIDETDSGLLVRPEVARQQLDMETGTKGGADGSGDGPEPGPGPGLGIPPGAGEGGGSPGGDPVSDRPNRYFGKATLDSQRVGRDAGRIAEEVIAHLVGLAGAKVSVTLEIQADVPAGVPETVVRIVTENGRTLKFESQGFERD